MGRGGRDTLPSSGYGPEQWRCQRTEGFHLLLWKSRGFHRNQQLGIVFTRFSVVFVSYIANVGGRTIHYFCFSCESYGNASMYPRQKSLPFNFCGGNSCRQCISRQLIDIVTAKLRSIIVLTICPGAISRTTALPSTSLCHLYNHKLSKKKTSL